MDYDPGLEPPPLTCQTGIPNGLATAAIFHRACRGTALRPCGKTAITLATAPQSRYPAVGSRTWRRIVRANQPACEPDARGGRPAGRSKSHPAANPRYQGTHSSHCGGKARPPADRHCRLDALSLAAGNSQELPGRQSGYRDRAVRDEFSRADPCSRPRRDRLRLHSLPRGTDGPRNRFCFSQSPLSPAYPPTIQGGRNGWRSLNCATRSSSCSPARSRPTITAPS